MNRDAGRFLSAVLFPLLLMAPAILAETNQTSPLIVPPNASSVACVIMNFSNQRGNVTSINLFDDTPGTSPTPIAIQNCPNSLGPGTACVVTASATSLTRHPVHCEFSFTTRAVLRASMIFLGPRDTPGPGTPTTTPTTTQTPGPGTPTAGPTSTPFQLRAAAPMHNEK